MDTYLHLPSVRTARCLTGLVQASLETGKRCARRDSCTRSAGRLTPICSTSKAAGLGADFAAGAFQPTRISGRRSRCRRSARDQRQKPARPFRRPSPVADNTRDMSQIRLSASAGNVGHRRSVVLTQSHPVLSPRLAVCPEHTCSLIRY
jgi:hypothetical protein